MDNEPHATPLATHRERYDLRRIAARLSSSFFSATLIIGGYRAAIVEPALQRLAILRVLARFVRDLAERGIETTISDDTPATCG
jgi:hypothetical protein